MVVDPYLGSESVLSGNERLSLWESVEPYLRGRADRSHGDHTDYLVTELSGPGGSRALLIEERC